MTLSLFCLPINILWIFKPINQTPSIILKGDIWVSQENWHMNSLPFLTFCQHWTHLLTQITGPHQSLKWQLRRVPREILILNTVIIIDTSLCQLSKDSFFTSAATFYRAGLHCCYGCLSRVKQVGHTITEEHQSLLTFRCPKAFFCILPNLTNEVGSMRI